MPLKDASGLSAAAHQIGLRIWSACLPIPVSAASKARHNSIVVSQWQPKVWCPLPPRHVCTCRQISCFWANFCVERMAEFEELSLDALRIFQREGAGGGIDSLTAPFLVLSCSLPLPWVFIGDCTFFSRPSGGEGGVRRARSVAFRALFWGLAGGAVSGALLARETPWRHLTHHHNGRIFTAGLATTDADIAHATSQLTARVAYVLVALS
eukprot:5473934-Amphidinium_carterae.1